MPIEFQCPQCNARLRVGDSAAGKRIKCVKCQQVVQVPGVSAESTTTPTEMWTVKTEDGQTFGPITKPELDQWVEEYRVTAQCQLLRSGADQWQWATELYPQLAPATAPSATPSTTPEIPSFTLETKPKDQVPAEKAAGPFIAAESGTSRVRKSTRSYPTMELASKLYRIMGWVILVLGLLGVAVFGFSALAAGIGALSGGMPTAAALVTIFTALTGIGLGILYVGVMVISLWFLSEAIKWMIDLESNTNRTSQLLQQLAARDEQSSSRIN